MSFKIEGWFPPASFISPISGVRYAVCGSNWVEIPADMSSEDIMAGWICTAKASAPKAPMYPKRMTKKQLLDNFTEKFKPIQNKVTKTPKALQPLLFAEPVKKIKKLII